MTRKRPDYVRSVYDAFRNNPERNRKGIEERLYLRVFTEIACARFKWIGLPDTIDERFLELTLFNRALSVFYYDTEYSEYFALRAAGTGKINMYDNPTTYTVIGNTMINKTLNAGRSVDAEGQTVPPECVPIWANFLRMPDWDIASIYATRIAELDRTIEINLLAQRHPFMVATDDNGKQSMINAFRQVKEGMPVIFTTEIMGKMMDEQVKVFDMKVDKEEVINLQLVKTKMWNECMTFLGINNANQDKRERLVVSEVSANNSQVLMARNVALNARRQAAEQINKLYNLSIEVQWNVDIENIAQESAISSGVQVTEA